MNRFLRVAACGLLLATSVAGCDAHRALMGFKNPVIAIANPAEPVSLPFREGPGGLVLLQARINGSTDAEFILDTGAPVTVLLENARTRALQVDMSKARRLGPEGDPAVPFGVIEPGFSIDFGGVSLSGLTAVVIPQASLPCQERFGAVDFQGVIGADLFRHFVVEIDHAAKQVRLFDPRSWRPGHGTVLPLDMNDGHIYTNLSLDRDGSRVGLRMHIDTGRNTALSLNAGSHPALVMPASGPRKTACYVQGIVESIRGAPVDLVLDTLVVKNVDPYYQREDRVRLDERNGSIGIGLLKRYVVTFDYAGKRMLLRERA